MRSRPLPTTMATSGSARLFVAISRLCVVAVSAGEPTTRTRSTVIDGPRKVICGLGQLCAEDRGVCGSFRRKFSPGRVRRVRRALSEPSAPDEVGGVSHRLRSAGDTERPRWWRVNRLGEAEEALACVCLGAWGAGHQSRRDPRGSLTQEGGRAA